MPPLTITRIPIIQYPYEGTRGIASLGARKAASLFCDDRMHNEPNGEPRLNFTGTAEDRKTCIHHQKLLVVDEEEDRFCIVHDPGIEREFLTGGQWWELSEQGKQEAKDIHKDFVNRMKNNTTPVNWWELGPTQLGPTLDPRARSKRKDGDGLTNKVATHVPAGLVPGLSEDNWKVVRDDESDYYSCESEEEWELVERSAESDPTAQKSKYGAQCIVM